MKDETKIWLHYADENLESANVLFKSNLLNPCLQNVQQTVEKTLKAILIEFDLPVKKTHNINELVMLLREAGVNLDITDDECDLLDSIYLPSKYPLGSALPNFEPTTDLCRQCITIAGRILASLRTLVQQKSI